MEGGLGRSVEQAGRAAAGEDLAFDPDDGMYVVLPVGLCEPVGSLEDGNAATFVAVAAAVVAVDAGVRGGGCADVPGPL